MNKTILIVDFEKQFVDDLQASLRHENFELLAATDGQQALGIFDSQTPDLVLTTALLPKVNGFELCKKITSGELGTVRPVIMYSGIYKAEKYRKEAMTGCGALEFLDTPISKSQLMKVIKQAFSEIPAGNVSRNGADSAAWRKPAGGSVKPDPLLGEHGDDVLGIDGLFETIEAQRSPSGASLQAEAAVLESTLPEPAPPLISNIDNSEIDAAVDAFRTDINVEQEIRERDQRFARQFEEELLQEGQTILEFEASQGSLATGSAEGTEKTVSTESDVLQLDDREVTGSILKSPMPTAESSTVAIPAISKATVRSRNWVPLVIAAILLGLAGLSFWWFQQ